MHLEPTFIFNYWAQFGNTENTSYNTFDTPEYGISIGHKCNTFLTRALKLP